jgi:hypothetical protein
MFVLVWIEEAIFFDYLVPEGVHSKSYRELFQLFAVFDISMPNLLSS